jgi:hypothetical protein
VSVAAPFVPVVAPGWDTPAELVTASTVVACLGIEERTLRNWVQRGCPQAVGGARPRYELGKVNVWGIYFAHLHARFQRTRQPLPDRISFEDAETWLLEREHELAPGPWSAFVVVPLAWDHPARAERLRLACAGLAPVPFEEAA